MPRTNASNFKQGNTGQLYVLRHIQDFIEHGFVRFSKDTGNDFVEGGDGLVTYYRFGEKIAADEYLEETVGIAGEGHQIAEILTGGLEVKTISNFLFRTNDMNELSGTLPFELWAKKDRKDYGWLLAMLYPNLRYIPEDNQPIHAVQPVLFSFLLVSYLGPFACVMFEDFPALAERLSELAQEKGFQLAPRSEEYPQGVPAGEEASLWLQNDPYIIENMWHIPLERLVDLATVTMIGGMPLLKHSTSINAETDGQYIGLQQARYNYLLQHSKQRAIPSEQQSPTDFYPADSSHIYADILQNLDTISNLNQEEYPFLFKALQSRGMRDHLNATLINMYAHETPTTINKLVCFLQTKSYLHEWGKSQGVTGSRFSWQSHLIFLTDAGLLKKYVDRNKPVNRQMYRSIPRYTSDILRKADNKARKYIEAGIKLSNFTKAEVILVSGQQRADFLYYGDERVISGMQQTIDNLYKEMANQIIAEQGYAIPAEIVDKLSLQVIERYWFDPFEPEEANPSQRREYKQAIRELDRLKNRFARLAKIIPCQYRRLTKEEKLAFHLPPRYTRLVYIK